MDEEIRSGLRVRNGGRAHQQQNREGPHLQSAAGEHRAQTLIAVVLHSLRLTRLNAELVIERLS